MIPPRLVVLLGLVLSSFLAGGCTVLDRELGDHLPQEGEAVFQVEGTNVGDVLEELGPPAKISALPGGFVFVYEHLEIRERQLGVSIGIDIIEWFKFSFGKADASLEALVLTFDQEGTLRSAGRTAQELDVGTGMGIQILVALEPVVDTSDVEADADPNNWGAFCLRDLPTTLNRRQSLDTGMAGVSLAGEMTSIGQYTLELRQ